MIVSHCEAIATQSSPTSACKVAITVGITDQNMRRNPPFRDSVNGLLDTDALLSLDDRPASKCGHPRVIERMTLGVASNDPKHRGTMSITDA
jgi:hypothetical protein